MNDINSKQFDTSRSGQSNVGPAAPTISLPKGGGAIRGIGEKFSANAVTGTGSFSVPVVLTPARSGTTPQLALSYDSGAGNGIFGFGWSLGLPSITRKTDKVLPRYDDAHSSDVFLLAGAEDLVPVPNNDHPIEGSYVITRYRPRIEGLFARIERWRNPDDPQDTHWRSITKDNVTTIYGKTSKERIVDPADASRIFSWLISESYDDKGNTTLYKYKAEDTANVDATQANERNRAQPANRHLKHIYYGNIESHLIQPDLNQMHWRFEIVLDYGEHPQENPTPDDTQMTWLCRHDPFSTYRAGFEVRTYRLCQRILVFHHFDHEADIGQDCLVRSMDFEYRNLRANQDDVKQGHPVASFITSITSRGYVRAASGYVSEPMPPLAFQYSPLNMQGDAEVDAQSLNLVSFGELDATSLENLPYGLDGSNYQWVDLNGEGISGILTEQADAWFYKPNLGGTFGPVERVATKPSLAALGQGQQQFLDLAGSGQLDLVEFAGATPGFFERTADQQWEIFVPFRSLPELTWNDPNLRFVDLNGDGHAEVLITESQVLTWYPSLAKDGFGEAEYVPQAFDEEKGPRLVFADGNQSIYLADMSGDGLTDLARIRNGEVCYWPNLGYGHFGAKVTMDNAPWFDSTEQFDQKRLRLADIDGSGSTDLLYLHTGGVSVFFNQSGNSWSNARVLDAFPHIDSLSSVTALDLFGNGTSCLVWSSSLPGDTRRSLRYADLMGGQKPHLLVSVKNNLGAETQVHYTSSTQFYLADKAHGTPWITRLNFPVQVVERVETFDRVSKNHFVTRYSYHHGYFDGIEREFRGFGRVEQLDAEEFETLAQTQILQDASNLAEWSHVPPVLTRTWFHTGAYSQAAGLASQFEKEYYREGDSSEKLDGLSPIQVKAMLLDDSILPDGLPLQESREAARALKGSILRQEIYALGNGEESDRPYTVSERNYTIELLQSVGANQHAIFFVHPRETIEFHYERKLFKVVGDRIVDPATAPVNAKNAADPRVTHELVLSVDEYGNVLRSASIAYGRRYGSGSADALIRPVEAQPLVWNELTTKQQTSQITYTENIYTNPIPNPLYPAKDLDNYRAPLLAASSTYEIVNLKPTSPDPDVTGLFKFDILLDALLGFPEIPYEDVQAAAANGTPARRLIEQQRTLYRPDDLGAAAGDINALLPWKQLESIALSGESYKLAFTHGLLTRVFKRDENLLLPTPADVLQGTGADQGGYVDLDGDGHWWIPSGRVFYHTTANAQDEKTEAQTHFYMPRRFTNPFAQETLVKYEYDLLPSVVTDAAQNTIRAMNNYRVMQPGQMTDPNGNRSAVAFDALGMVVGTAIMGKGGDSSGDSLQTFVENLPDAQLQAHLAHPLANPLDVLGQPLESPLDILVHATSRLLYDLFAYQRTQAAAQPQPAVVYTLTRETHVADVTDPHPLKFQHSFSYSDGFGREIQKKMQAEPGPLLEGGPVVAERWVGSGWTIYNNKGKPVRKYEPFFTSTHLFEADKKVGVSSILFYDPLERVIATLHPNHTYEKVVFDPWQQVTYDVNDTVTALDPRADTDVGDFFKGLTDDELIPTWYDTRTDANKALAKWSDTDPQTHEAIPENARIRAAELAAAKQAAIHANTPTIAYFDSLGRNIITLAHNRFEQDGANIEEKYATRTQFDIEGNQRSVTDARNRIVMRYEFDMLSNRIHQASMDAGERWMLNDALGKAIRAWDSRTHTFRTEYDGLRRPTRSYVIGTDTSNVEILFEHVIYGDSAATGLSADDILKNNLRGKPYQHFDQAGIVTTAPYDFKGNLLESRRQLVSGYKQMLDWAHPPAYGETFANLTRYDALNRPIQIIAPHLDQPNVQCDVIQPIYNEANLLNNLDVWRQVSQPASVLDAATALLHVVTNINYNAKGQREQIEYGNNVTTHYEYDTATFRLMRLFTTRNDAAFGTDCAPPPDSYCGVQNLRYTYDPIGNIAAIRDEAQQTIYFRKKRVEPSAAYVYDALYRLLTGSGREHLGQTNNHSNPPTRPDAWNTFHIIKDQPGDGNAMGTYSETYQYDEVGNLLRMRHLGTDPNNPGWTLCYQYALDSNRLLSTGGPHDSADATSDCGANYGATPLLPDHYTYDWHGNMTSMPHLPTMQWDFQDRLHSTTAQVVNTGTPETTYYVYDAHGQRVRKVTERQAAVGADPKRKSERIYLGGFEIYREYNGDGTNVTLERETLHLMDDKQRVALIETRTQGNDPAPDKLIRFQFNNHLGTASLELDEQAQIISYEEYFPYGGTSYQAVRNQNETPKRYRYTGKERDEENGLSYHGARYYAPWLGRWTSCDPLDPKTGSNLYTYAKANPTTFYDPTGRDDKPVVEPPKLNDPDLPKNADKPTTAGFSVRHPIAAVQIGEFVHGSTNITTTAVRFSTRIGLEENQAKEGSEVNAFRHAFWQGMIAEKFGQNTAREVGYAHEASLPKDLLARTFTGKSAMSQADQMTDLLNNVIGRKIASENPKATNQELAIKTLDQFHTEGLFTATKNPDGSVTVSQTKISDEKYEKALQVLKSLNEGGFTTAEQKQIDDRAAKDQERRERFQKL